MSKEVTNKKYEEFWNNKELDIKSSEEIDNENKKIKKRQTMPRKKVEIIKEEVNNFTEQPITIEQPTKTLKKIYEQYVIDGQPYKIFLRGQIIFDSKKHKINPIFYDDYFILFGNKYIYKGIRFEKY